MDFNMGSATQTKTSIITQTKTSIIFLYAE